MNTAELDATAKILLRQSPVVWAGNLLGITVCGIVLMHDYPPVQVSAWCATNYLLFFIRVREWRRFRLGGLRTAQALRAWLRDYSGFAVLGGLIWGIGAFAFIDTYRPEQMVFLLVAILGVASGALPSLSSYFPAYACFASPLLLLVAFKLALIDEGDTTALSILAILYLGGSLIMSRNLAATISSSITTDLENAHLLERVTFEKAAAERANAEKSQFLAAASHDVRQPLHAAGFFLESLGRRLDSAAQKELYDRLHDSIDVLETMFDTLLEISRLDAGYVKPQISDVALESILRSVVAELNPGAERKHLGFEYLPTQAIVQTDPVLLTNIVRNLVSNAIKYTDKGTVQLYSAYENGFVKVSVSDTGCGISGEDQKQIFAPYYQVGNEARDRSKGFGLGLAVVDLSSRLLGHSLSVQSTPGEGSTFTIALRQGDASRVAKAADLPRRHDLTGVHVLVIDDEPGILSGMRILLSDWGCRVTTGESAAGALLALSTVTQPPDVLVCDYRLRDGLDGFAAIGLLREKIDTELPAAMMSGDTHPELLARAESENLYLLHKPVKPTHLMKIIAELV